MHKYNTQTSKQNQQGFASLVVGLILIIVLALLTIGFAQLTRHEQQQALSKQLATQAYYAAESGINDSVKAIGTSSLKSQLLTDPNLNKPKCLANNVPGATPVISADNGVSYSCVILSLETDDLTYNNVEADSARTVVTSTTGDTLDKLNITWSSMDGHTTFPGSAGVFKKVQDWSAPAVIQFSITPVSGGLTRSNLINNTYTAYLYPSSDSGSASYSTDLNDQAKIIAGNCGTDADNPGDCSVTISGISATGAGKGPYLIHFLNLYDKSEVTITGKNSAGEPIKFSGGQAKIDVTGKAKNVLKRLQVRVPIGDSGYSLSNYALEAQDICKRISTAPGYTRFVAATSDNATANAGDVCYLED